MSIDNLLVGTIAFIVLILLVAGLIRRRRDLKHMLEKTRDTGQKQEKQVGQALSRLKGVPAFSMRRAYVFEFDGQKFVAHKVYVASDSSLVDPKTKKMWQPPEGYVPKPLVYRTWLGWKAIPVFVVDPNGKFLDFKLDPNGKIEVEGKTLNPEFAFALFNSKILKKMAVSLATDPQMFLMGLGVGAFILAILIFVVLPFMGIPVMIGKKPVDITIRYSVPQHLPPAGNFTPHG